jgi:CubicO group peptidase (beta-lactamase class C family)
VAEPGDPVLPALPGVERQEHPLRSVRTRITLSAFAVVLGSACAIPSSLHAQVVDADALRSLDAYIAGAVEEWDLPGLAIAIVAGDSVVFSRGYGLRDIERPEPVDTGTRFAIGSTTKAMISVALGILVDEGAVEWDAPVITYLPWFRVGDPYITRELTVRDLLTHRAGFPNIDQIWTNPGFTTDDILHRIAELEPVYSLRSSFIYQNVMYAVAGAVIEAAAGMPWDAFLHARIFEPLGMTATQATLGAVEGQPNVASPHTNAGGTIRLTRNTPVDAVGPAGSVWSSVDDMARWVRFNLNGGELEGTRLLDQATHREIVSPQVIAPASMYPTMTIVQPRFFTYGLAWFIHDYRGEAVVMHTGSISGMNALAGMLPDRGVGVYVLANAGGAELRHALMYRVFDLFAGAPERDWSTELRELYAPRAQPAAPPAGRDEGGGQPSLPLQRYSGTFTAPIFGDVTVTLRDGALHLDSEFNRAGTLEHVRYDTFRVEWEGEVGGTAPVIFVPDGTGGVRAVRVFRATFER